MKYPPEYWENIRAHKMSGPGPEEWPKDIQAISLEGLGLIGLDAQGRLYWDGKRLPTVTLTRWQRLGAILVVLSAAIGALATTASAIADWKALAIPEALKLASPPVHDTSHTTTAQRSQIELPM